MWQGWKAAQYAGVTSCLMICFEQQLSVYTSDVLSFQCCLKFHVLSLLSCTHLIRTSAEERCDLVLLMLTGGHAHTMGHKRQTPLIQGCTVPSQSALLAPFMGKHSSGQGTNYSPWASRDLP